MRVDHLTLNFEYDEKLGFYQWEKNKKQKLIVKIKMSCDVKKASLTDHLNDTIDYDEVDQLIAKLLQDRHFHLIETFAEEIAQSLLKKWPEVSLELTVNKPEAISHAKEVSVTIYRGPVFQS